MSVPVFQSYTPGVNDDINAKFKGLMNANIETTQQLQWILQHLDSSNVTKLDTNRTTIRSQLGETVINGPLLVMKDKQPTPVIRLQMGYDPTSLDFIFNLMNAAGDVTVNIDSSGNLTVERGTFKGSITIGTGDNVFKVDANGMYLGDATFADAPFRVTMTGAATATNLTITGGTIRTAAAGNDRIELTGSGLTSYNGTTASVVADGGYLTDFAISGGTQALGKQVTHAVVGYKYKGIIKSFSLGFQIQGVNTQRMEKAISEVGVRCVASAGLEIGSSLYHLEPVQELTQDDINYLPPLPIDGTKFVQFSDDNERDKFFYLVQDDPLPATITTAIITANYTLG